MDEKYWALTLVVILALWWVWNNWHQSPHTLVKAKDGHSYLVRDLPDKQQAADILADLRSRLSKVVKDLKTQYPHNVDVERLAVRFRPAGLFESIPNGKLTSYNVNKGYQIGLCLREISENERFIDTNTLMFVALHELAHAMTVSIGHTEEFWEHFKFLLRHSVNKGYYDYHPYRSHPKKYCNIIITSSPLD